MVTFSFFDCYATSKLCGKLKLATLWAKSMPIGFADGDADGKSGWVLIRPRIPDTNSATNLATNSGQKKTFIPLDPNLDPFDSFFGSEFGSVWLFWADVRIRYLHPNAAEIPLWFSNSDAISDPFSWCDIGSVFLMRYRNRFPDAISDPFSWCDIGSVFLMRYRIRFPDPFSSFVPVNNYKSVRGLVEGAIYPM